MKDANALVNTDTSISVATDKNTILTTDTSTTSMKPVLDDEKSIEADDLLQDDSGTFPDIPEFTPPLRIQATRVTERLSGSLSTLQVPPHLNQQMRRRKSESAAMSSRSGSEFDAGSSISSLEDAGIETDLLTDKMGFLELDLKEQQQYSQKLNTSWSNLGPVVERLSEETMDDCHAFSDIKQREGRVSRGGSITTGGEHSSTGLEPLDEVDDEDEDQGGNVKITNMADILEVAEEDVTEAQTSRPST